MEEFEVPYTFGTIDVTHGTIAVSGKEKFDQMKDWVDSPFHEYQCNKEGGHFIIAKKHKKVNCAAKDCNKWANKNCGHGMCKKCCVELQQKSNKKSACTLLKQHRLPKRGESATDSDTGATGE